VHWLTLSVSSGICIACLFGDKNRSAIWGDLFLVLHQTQRSFFYEVFMMAVLFGPQVVASFCFFRVGGKTEVTTFRDEGCHKANKSRMNQMKLVLR